MVELIFIPDCVLAKGVLGREENRDRWSTAVDVDWNGAIPKKGFLELVADDLSVGDAI